jgi:uncharacterized protein (TIGR00288 family)
LGSGRSLPERFQSIVAPRRAAGADADRANLEAPMSAEPLIAVFIDYENVAHGIEGGKSGGFRIDLVMKRLLEKGRIVFKRAYCDWSRYRSAVRELHLNGIELVDIPQSKLSGKNSADIRMVVDALDLCYAKEHIDVFALVSGDSDFSPLVSKLKENDKRVVGCGVKESTSDLLISGCDEFIYYDDLVREAARSQPQRKKARPSEDKRGEAMERLAGIVRSLAGEYEPLWGSLVKQTIKRVYPGFSESYYGYRTFADLLEDAQTEGLITLELDESRGNYKVRPTGE